VKETQDVPRASASKTLEDGRRGVRIDGGGGGEILRSL